MACELLAASVSSFEPAVLNQYYCLDSILGLRLSLHQRLTYQLLILPLLLHLSSE
jgi:hypothetical protein